MQKHDINERYQKLLYYEIISLEFPAINQIGVSKNLTFQQCLVLTSSDSVVPREYLQFALNSHIKQPRSRGIILKIMYKCYNFTP